MEPNNKLECGSLVQVKPDYDGPFAATIVTVTEVNSFGVMGYVQVLEEDGGQDYIRLGWEDIEYVGHACWMVDDELTICIDLLKGFFKDEPEKVNIWMTTPNPLLGNVVPMDMIDRGRGHKLIQFIKNCLEGETL